uniref:Reverse transcriptase zinc-binding domain-containing protein n=1 Tax=Glossina brevipalpis TaxID=37001 RepID=A0A1A9WZX9_9MUSC
MDLKILSYNIRGLKDEMIILATNARTLQNMINDLLTFCETKTVDITLDFCNIMIFRASGKRQNYEKWTLKDKEIQVRTEYSYLNMTLASNIDSTAQVKKLRSKVKKALSPLFPEEIITPKKQYEICRNICINIYFTSYLHQYWPYNDDEAIDQLQGYFIKRILKLSLQLKTPLHVLLLETGSESWFLIYLESYLNYITRILYERSPNALIYKLSLLIVEHKLLWAQNLSWKSSVSRDNWQNTCRLYIEERRKKYETKYLRLQQSVDVFYKKLDYTKGQSYMFMCENLSVPGIRWIFKARCDLLCLNKSHFSKKGYKFCQLCKTKSLETIQHFIGLCPSLKDIRKAFLKSEIILEQQDIIDVLNGRRGWEALGDYVHNAWEHRCENIRFKKVG